jgi:hypothetical protein
VEAMGRWPGSTARPGNGKHGPMGGERKRTLLHERGKPSRGSRCRTRRLRSQLMAGTTNTRLRCRRRRLRRFHRCVGGRAPALHTTTRHTLTPTRRGSCVLRSCSFRLWLSLLWPSCEASFSSILTLTQCSERRALKPLAFCVCPQALTCGTFIHPSEPQRRNTPQEHSAGEHAASEAGLVARSLTAASGLRRTRFLTGPARLLTRGCTDRPGDA